MDFSLKTYPRAPTEDDHPDDDPDSFIATGEYGLFASWAYVDGRLAVAYEPHNSQEGVLEDLGVDDAAALAQAGGSLGTMALQPWDRSSNVYDLADATEIRIEYDPEILHGREVGPGSIPDGDPELDPAMNAWIARDRDAIVEAIRLHGGEMR